MSMYTTSVNVLSTDVVPVYNRYICTMREELLNLTLNAVQS